MQASLVKLLEMQLQLRPAFRQSHEPLTVSHTAKNCCGMFQYSKPVINSLRLTKVRRF